MITYSHGNEIATKHDKIVMVKVMKAVSQLPKPVFEFLWKYNVTIRVCDVKKETNVQGRGFCTFDEIQNSDEFRFNLCIDTNETYLNSIYFVLCHEIGHFFDRVIGCIERNATFTEKNLFENSISRNSKIIQQCIFNEHDLFYYYHKDKDKTTSEREKEWMLNDYAEIFADSFAELLMGKKSSTCPQAKYHILKYMHKYIPREKTE